MRNKLLAMLLALCMVMTMVPVMAFATEAGDGNDDDENQTPTACKCEECTTNSHNCTADSPCNGTGCTTCGSTPPVEEKNCTCGCAITTGSCCTEGSCACTKGSAPCGNTSCKAEHKTETPPTTETCSTCGCDLKCGKGCETKCVCDAENPCGDKCNKKPGTTDPTKPGGEYGDYDENNHCLCDDSACGSVSHRGPAMGTIGDYEYGAVCVNVPENGSICNACLEAIAAKAGNNQGGDKKDDEQKPAQPTTPTTPAANPNAPQKAEDFIDIQPGTWYNDSVTAMLQKGWFVGQTGGSFAPRNPTTGAEVVVILSRVLGYDLVTTGANWSAEATEWAAAHGLSDGISITTTGGLARQDLILMLWRAAGKPDSSYPLSFSDIGGVSGDALTALRWAVENGIVQGNPDGTANPTGATLRGEMAALMVRYDNAVNG